MNMRTQNWRRTFPSLMIALLTAACAKSHSSTRPADVANVPDVPGTARLYVMNTGDQWLKASKNTVVDDQRALVSVSEGRYAILFLPAGRHALSCAGMAVAPTVFDAVAGETYYLQTYLGSRKTKQICGLLPPELGEKALAEFTEPPEQPQYWGMGGKK